MLKIIYACNNGYIDCLQLSILSILRRTKETIHFYVLTMDFTDVDPNFLALSDVNEQRMREFVKSFNPKNNFKKLDCSSYYKKYLSKNKNESSVCSPYTNLRLVMDKIGLKGKIIYLDTDIMCNGDIKELDEIDLKGKTLGANRDYLGAYWHPQWKKYINAGVLIIDLDKNEKTHLLAKARTFLNKKKFKLADQTAIFKACKGTKSYIIFPGEFRYNTQQPTMLPHTLLKHFCAGWVNGRWQNIKQTNIAAVHQKLKIHAFDEDYKIWKKIKLK